MFICPIMICSNNIMTIYYVHLTCSENAKKKKNVTVQNFLKWNNVLAKQAKQNEFFLTK